MTSPDLAEEAGRGVFLVAGFAGFVRFFGSTGFARFAGTGSPPLGGHLVDHHDSIPIGRLPASGVVGDPRAPRRRSYSGPGIGGGGNATSDAYTWRADGTKLRHMDAQLPFCEECGCVGARLSGIQPDDTGIVHWTLYRCGHVKTVSL